LVLVHEHVALEGAELDEVTLHLLDSLVRDRRQPRASSMYGGLGGRKEDGQGDLDACIDQRVAGWFEEPTRREDAVDDRRVTAGREPARGLRHDHHHQGVLLVRFGQPWLDVASDDGMEPPIGLDVNAPFRSRGQFYGHGGLASPGRPGQQQHLSGNRRHAASLAW